MRLIDAERLCENCKDFPQCKGEFKAECAVYVEVAAQPTIAPASLRLKGEWISVEDRLPKDWEDVLVLLQCGDCIVAARSGKYWRERWCHSLIDRPPTHWMPLPEPPNCGADMRGETHDS